MPSAKRLMDLCFRSMVKQAININRFENCHSKWSAAWSFQVYFSVPHKAWNSVRKLVICSISISGGVGKRFMLRSASRISHNIR